MTNANHPTDPVAAPRGIDHIVAGVSTSDGDGVKLTRVLQQPLQKRLDPYLMLDAFGSDNPGDYIGAFPTIRTVGSKPSPT
jgi:redox-sensitive bicupin YhaK (pirin superfamily)